MHKTQDTDNEIYKWGGVVNLDLYYIYTVELITKHTHINSYDGI